MPKLSNDLDADDYRVTNLADGEDLQDAVTVAQLGNLGPLLALLVIEMRVQSKLLADLPQALETRPILRPPIDLPAMRRALAHPAHRST